MRAGIDQLRAQRDDPLITPWRTGLDDQQRITGLLSHASAASSDRSRLVELANHVARNDEIGRRRRGR